MLALIALAAPSLAATLVVDPSDSAAYATVQEAIDEAATGDTIDIAAGTFTECVDLSGLDLTLSGAGSGSTTLDGAGGCSPVVLAEDGETATISGMTIENDGQRGLEGDEAILTLDDVVFDGLGNASSYGGAAYIDEGSLTATDVTFSSNTAYAGGALYATDGVALTLERVSLSGNSAIYGGALYLSDSGADVSLDLTDCTLSSNEASSSGGGVYAADEAALTGSGTTWEDNVSTNGQGGALYLSDEVTYTSDGATWDGNTAEAGRGGALYAYTDSVVTITDGEFVDNAAAYGAHAYSYYGEITVGTTDFSGGVATSTAGALYANAATAVLSDVTFSSNTAGSSGGAIYAYYEATLAVSSATFTANTAGNSGGDIGAYVGDTIELSAISSTGASADDTNGYGGSISLSGGVGDVTISDLDISGASAASGGALSINTEAAATLTDASFSGNTATNYGGAVYWYDPYDAGSLSVSGSTFDGNTAETYYGGGLYFYAGGAGGGTLAVDTSTFEGNVAELRGGGVYAGYAGDLTLSHNAFIENEASNGEYYYYGGGGLYAYQPDSLEATNNTFCGNEAWSGGGVYVAGAGAGGGESWTNNVFQENLAYWNGGGMYVYGGDAFELVNNSLLGNDAFEDGGGVYLYDSAPTITNNLFGWTQDGDALYAYGSTTADASAVTHNSFFDNRRYDAGGAFDFDTAADGNQTADPLLRDYTLDADCSNDDLRLDSTSPLVDAGDASITDPDGTTSDIGAYGGPGSPIVDADEDGYDSLDDCDDDDASVNPGATESCNEVDDDCDGDIDEAGADGETLWYADADGDGFGDPDSSLSACDPPEGTVAVAGDCDDEDAGVNPDAEDIEDDGIDQDCDGEDATSGGDDGGGDDGGGDDGGGDDGGGDDGGGDDGGGDDGGGGVNAGDDDDDDVKAGCSTLPMGDAGLLGLLGLGLALAPRRRRQDG
jgi:predicted outer membrane repeat protein/parallel beta-helix repeat protein